MSAWESFGSTYLEAATSTLPLHRLVALATGFIGSLVISKQTHISIFESVSKLSVAGLIDLKGGIIGAASLANVFAGVGLVIAGWIGSRVLLRLVFALAAKLTGLQKRAADARASSTIKPTDPIADRQAMVALIDSSLEQPRERIRTLNSAMELSMSLALGLLVASWWGNILDTTIGVFLLLVSLGFGVASVRLFLSEYFGAAMLRAQLQGRKTPTPSDVR